jgi:programmed cell death protein 5
MENLAPVDPKEIPEGFTADSGGPAGGGTDAASLKKLQMEEQKKAILEQAMSQEALARLGRIKLVKPDKADAVERQIVALAMQGKLPGKINEPKLIELLERASRGEATVEAAAKERISIQRKKYAFDDDSDDDNDDDLM